MLSKRLTLGVSVLALAASNAAAQVTTVATNRSEVIDRGTDNKAQVENSAEGNERNNSLIEFTGNRNRATTIQFGDDNNATTRETGDLNTAAIRQFGFRNRATLHQVGSSNGSSVDQYLDPRIDVVGDRTVFVAQLGDANSSSVVQVAWNNVANVMQGTADSPGTRSNGGVSTIYQFSAGNTATVTMVGGSSDAPNRSHVEQTRIDPIVTNSNATVNISGSFNLSYLYQVGASNVSSHSVSGTQNTIIGRSYGNSLQSSVLQQGYRNFVSVNQFAGDRNFSQVEQRDDSGGDRQVYVSQGGSDHSSTVSQRFTGNTVLVDQGGAGTVSSVTQNAVGNMARVYLRDGSVSALNKSTILQDSGMVTLDTRFLADAAIRGAGNESNITQTGTRHVASVDVAGGGIGSDEAGRRRGNSVAIVQGPAMANGAPSRGSGAGHSARVQVGVTPGGGVGTVTALEQHGEHPSMGNQATIRQEGQFDRVTVRQSTRFWEADGGAVADVSARGNSNQIDLSQFGRQTAMVTQGLGRDSIFTATSYDSGGSPRAGGAVLFAGGRGSNSIVAAQYGDRNRVDIWQEGTDDHVSIWQKTGSADNVVSVNQGRQTGGFAVDGFDCSFRCQFANDARASVVQAGRFNSLSIIQYGVGAAGGADARIEQNGTGSSASPNVARITQFHTSAEASILQTADVGPSPLGSPASGTSGDPSYFAGGARGVEARIRQSGAALSARIEQRGLGQYAFIDQSGANSASILQEVGATNATAIITQSGSGNSYNVVQTQPGQYINVSQTGTNNSVTNVISRP